MIVNTPWICSVLILMIVNNPWISQLNYSAVVLFGQFPWFSCFFFHFYEYYKTIQCSEPNWLNYLLLGMCLQVQSADNLGQKPNLLISIPWRLNRDLI